MARTLNPESNPGFKGHSYEHGRGDPCVKCGEIHSCRRSEEFKDNMSRKYSNGGHPRLGIPLPRTDRRKKWQHKIRGAGNPFSGKRHTGLQKLKWSLTRVGASNPNWRGGRKEYMGFTSSLKEAVREYYKRKCVLCGKTEKKNGARLSVHHIDDDKLNSDFYNLVPLCISCHVSLTAAHLTVDMTHKEVIVVPCICGRTKRPLQVRTPTQRKF